MLAKDVLVFLVPLLEGQCRLRWANWTMLLTRMLHAGLERLLFVERLC